jgi:hypothetical protein
LLTQNLHIKIYIIAKFREKAIYHRSLSCFLSFFVSLTLFGAFAQKQYGKFVQYNQGLEIFKNFCKKLTKQIKTT